MATYREIVSLILDEMKLIAVDSTFTQEHVIFLADKYRAALIYAALKQRKFYDIPDCDYQEVCLDLKPATGALACEGLLKSTKKLPTLLGAGQVKVYPREWQAAAANFSWVPQERFPFIGNNKYTEKFIYVTDSPEGYVYVKSRNAQWRNLKKIRVYAVFYDSEGAAELACCDCDKECDVLDSKFPLEDVFIPNLIQSVVNELGGKVYLPRDVQNDAADGLSGLSVNQQDNQQKESSK